MPCLVHYLVSFIVYAVYMQIAYLPTCPIWTYPSPSRNECVCGNSRREAIICNSETLTVQLTVEFFCLMTFNNNGLNTTLLGTCPYGYKRILPKNVSMSQIYEDSSLCSFKGQLCGECAENYMIPANLYYLGCIKCKNYNNGWINFAVACCISSFKNIFIL